jgi:hypothetical protein
MITRRHLLRAVAAGAFATLPQPGASAQVKAQAGARASGQTDAPVVRKLTRMIVGYPPGGSTDVIARLLIDQMKGYAPTIIIDNRPGTGGRLALETLKVAPPDGSVMALTPATTIAVYPHIYKPIGYDALADFIAVAPVASFSSVLSVGPMVPAAVTTLPDFNAWCRANPTRATYGTTGAGSVLHFAGMMLGKAADFEFTHVPYKGAGPVLQDLLGGRQCDLVGVAPHRRRRPAPARQQRRGALAVPAGCPDLRGGRLPADHDVRMAGRVRARENAGRDRRGPQPLDPRRTAHQRGAHRPHQPVLRGERPVAAGIRGASEVRLRALGRHCEGDRVHGGGVTRAIRKTAK